MENSRQGMLEDSQKFLTFFIRDVEYGIPIENVVEIIGVQPITVVPDVPSFVKGVINLRGNVYPVLSVRLRFGADEVDYDDKTCVIVVSINDVSVGLIVDTVSEVMSILSSNIEPPSKIQKKDGSRFVQAMGKLEDRILIILNGNKLLFDDEMKQIEKAVKSKEKK